MSLIALLFAYPPMGAAEPGKGAVQPWMSGAPPNNKRMEHALSPAECEKGDYWDYSAATCAPLPAAGKARWAAHKNIFLTQGFASGPRGRDRFAIPHMLRKALGLSPSSNHYLDLSLTLTAEKWTFPERGYPELFQIGEEDKNGIPYIDAQHPHPSPLMELTLSDTIRLGEEKKHLKLFFAPRGQATEGPVVFMHRPTGRMNPDAPLGHHVGQDVSHISSTVIGASIGLRSTRVELSTFHGTEPEPAKVNLPLGTPNSFAARLIQEWGEHHAAMLSAAYVKRPEERLRDIHHIWRASASLYTDHSLPSGWRIHQAYVYGLVTDYDHVRSLQSVLGEFWLHKQDHPYNFWGRAELVQRSPEELAISHPTPRNPLWVAALTLGYSHDLVKVAGLTFRLGASGTRYWAPAAFRPAYGGNPQAAHIFLQIHDAEMGNLL